MGKVKSGKKGGGHGGTGPYDRPPKSNNIFKMNKDYGQHILKNPGVSDVSLLWSNFCRTESINRETRLSSTKPSYNRLTPSWKLAPEQET
jgi:hypothetical protein